MKRLAIVILLVMMSAGPAMAGDGRGNDEVVRVREAPAVTGTEVTKWQLRYYNELLRSIALEYTGLCFKDLRWINANREIKRLRGEVKQLLKE